MMKQILIATLLSVGFASANANVIFFDDFDNEVPDEVVQTGSDTDYDSFTNWTVSDGTVDLVANGDWNLTCAGNTGKCVDLDGSINNAGIFTSTLFTLSAGNYVLSFDVSGNQRNSPSDSMAIELGGFVTESVTLAATAPWQTLTYFFTVSADSTNDISFNHAGGDNIGIMLDNVSVTDVNAPSTVALLGLGLFGLAMRRRKQSKRSNP